VPTTRILLLRHAETSAPDRFHGAESDVGLGPNGRAQAEQVAPILAALRPQALYCSAMRRARETAEPIARACGMTAQVLETLHERRMGPLSGTSREASWAIYEEARIRWMAGDLDHTHEGGESYAEIQRRVVPVFEDLAARHLGQTIVVVAHGVVIRVTVCSLVEGGNPRDFSRIPIEFVGIHDLHCDGARWWIDD
jgi:broad specificity phosphatase PhoE